MGGTLLPLYLITLLLDIAITKDLVTPSVSEHVFRTELVSLTFTERQSKWIIISQNAQI
jgi:hypothetical protein